MSSTSNTEQQVAMAIDKTEQEASSVLKEQATAQAVAQAAQVPFSERLPSIEDTLQMARLAAVVYDENPIKSYKDAAKSKDTTSYKTSLVDEGGTDTEMWFYECEEEGTEAILTFSAKNKRCTVIFRGTEVGGDTTLSESLKDIGSDLTGFKKPLAGPDDEEDGHPDCLVHQGFRSQYYGKVTEFRSDGKVATDLRAEEGSIKGMVLETALLQKVQKVLDFQAKNDSDTELFVTGHSLGAALSVLFGVRLAHKHPTKHVQVINFGCPKVGNAAFAQLVKNKENLLVQRVAHKHDVITRAPNFNYHHVGHTIQIDEASEPRAFKWHAGRSYWTNWNPFFGLLLGGIGDHSMEFGYIRALNSHVNSRSDSTVEKPWLTEYTEQEK